MSKNTLRLVSTAEVAKTLGISVRLLTTLKQERRDGFPAPKVKISGRNYYDPAEIEAFVKRAGQVRGVKRRRTDPLPIAVEIEI